MKTKFRKNRPIRFRVWNSVENKWIHGPGYAVNLFGETVLLGEFMRVPLQEINDCVALQYTGLKDKKGCDIYEGDIVEQEGVASAVAWEWKYGYWSVYGHDLLGNFNRDVKVIGNIFEHPELV